MRVDFPAPLSPTTPSTSPFVIFRLTSLRAVIVPKNLDIDFASTYEVQTPIVDDNGEAVLDEDDEPTYNVTTENTYKIDKLKSDKKKQVNEAAGRLLKPTDWYVIRKSERDVDIPTNIATERGSIVTKSNEFVATIDALTTVESVLRYTFNFNAVEEAE